MAGIHLAQRRGDSPAVKEQLVEYISHFGKKPCCYSDVVPYLDVISGDGVAPFLKQVKMNQVDSWRILAQVMQRHPEIQKVTPSQIQEVNLWFQLSRRLGHLSQVDAPTKLELIQEAMSCYEVAQKIPKEVTELCLGDDLLILVSRMIQEISQTGISLQGASLIPQNPILFPSFCWLPPFWNTDSCIPSIGHPLQVLPIDLVAG